MDTKFEEGEWSKARNIAIIALKKGFSIEDIIELTGLSKEDLLKLKK